MFKEIWLHFFPFHALTENHCVLNKTTKDIVKDETEEYVREKKFRQEQFKDLGVEAFHSHRLRILASTAFYDNYKEQVNTLTPAGNWDKDEASFIVLMTEKGKQFESIAFSNWLNKHTERQKIVFIIGGAAGHGKQIIERANFKLSLSEFTFPHKLARLLLVEQIYRAQTIRANHPYNK